MKKALFSLIGLGWVLVANAQSKPIIRLDFNPNGRHNKEVLEPGFRPWLPPTGSSVCETTAEGITFTLTAEEGRSLSTTWNKGFVQNELNRDRNARLTGDALVLFPGQAEGRITLSIQGLPAGRHGLQTYHNSSENPATTAVKSINIFLNGALVCRELVPSRREAEAAKAAVSIVEFEVSGPEERVEITYSTLGTPVVGDAEKRTVSGTPIINGFELNAVPAAKQARTPYPRSGDQHVAADEGTCFLTWSPALGKVVSHDLYFGTDSTRVAQATEPMAAGLTDTCFTMKDLSVHEVYYWRVDERDEVGEVTPGKVWDFRLRRLAFPGAEGYGRYATGGRGGAVYHVTNLENNHEPGSFLYGLVDLEGPRTIVFDVAGVIDMEFRAVFADPYVTIAAQTAPGKGICLKHSNLNIGNESVCRFLRARRGYGLTGNAMGQAGSNYSIVDHTTAAWGSDETYSSRGAHNITFQYSLIAEALGITGHGHYGAGKNHGFAATIGGDVATFSHNCLVHCQGRNWSMGGGLDGEGYYGGRLDIFNNLVYNWGARATDGGAHEVNFVNNYYKAGPAEGFPFLLNAQLEGLGKGSQRYHVSGNLRQAPDNGALTEDKEGDTYKYTVYSKQILDWEVWSAQPFFPSYADIHSARDAYKIVLSDAGATRPCRDEQHKRLQREILEAGYHYTGSRSGVKGQIDHEDDAGGFEEFPEEHRPEGYDTDQDGMPDWYERLTGSDPMTADHNADPDGDGFTLLEDYLNRLAQPLIRMKAGETVVFDLTEEFMGFTDRPVFRLCTKSRLAKAKVKGAQLTLRAAKKSGIGEITVACTDAESSRFERTITVAVE